MAVYTRQSGVQAGKEIILYAIFLDNAGNLINADSLPEIYIYDDSVSETTIQDEVDSSSFDNAFAGPLEPELLSTGYYKLEYTVPSGSTSGTWHDVWVAEVETVESTDILSFNVSTAVTLSTQSIGNNTMIIIQLDSTIASLDGEASLGEDVKLFFTTIYSPLYASPDLVRMEVGRWIEHISDDTLALMIHWASKEADFVNGAAPNRAADLRFDKTKFVIYDAALRCLMMPGGGAVTAAESSSGGKKQLGDLLIQGGSGTAAEIDEATMAWLQKQRRDWFKVVNAGATIVPGGSFSPTFAMKGKYDPDQRRTGRLWEDPREVSYAIPTVNRKGTSYAPDGRKRLRGRFGFRGRPGGIGGDDE